MTQHDIAEGATSDVARSAPPAQQKSGSTALRVLNGAREFVKFGIVGGSGVLVNLAVVYLVTKALELGWDIHENEVFFNLFGTRWNVRWYHVIMTIAFITANTWNYQLNRSWTFRNVPKRSWLRGYFPFLATGIVAFAVSQIVATLLMNPTTPVALPDDIFDDSTGLRTKFYWAAGISTLIAMPVNFIINKLWTFRKPKAARSSTAA